MKIKERPKDLPDYERPPLNEVVLSIQYATLPKFKIPHVGVLWQRFRSKYPHFSEQTVIPTKFETFGGPGLASEAQQLWLQLEGGSFDMYRIWFEENGKPDLLQIQRDRILHNWRGTDGGEEYPHYELICANFADEVATFQDFLRAEDLGELRPNQCEVTYINIVELPDGDNTHCALESITPLWNDRYDDFARLGVTAENVHAGLRFIFSDQEGKPQGRLYIQFQPAFRVKDKLPVWRIELTARGKPLTESVDAAFDLLDLERRLIVQVFDRMTDKKMHILWGRK